VKSSSLLKRLSLVVKRRPVLIFSLIVILGLLTLTFLGEQLAPYDPLGVDLPGKLQSPSAAHVLGTDDMGRDVLSRIMAGTRLSTATIAVIMSSSLLIGILVGTVAGYLGGRFDEALMRLTEVFLAFPGLILALAIAAALGPSLINAMLAISIVWWPWYARMVRGQVLAVKQNQYVEAARAIGASGFRIAVRHILPNCMMPVIIQASMDMGSALVTTAGLSFIGLGAQAPTPEWGAMVGIGRRYLLSAWWISTFPGLAIFITILGLNLLGDTLQDILWSRHE
jgi:peptide/nickel transport system permease protein